MISNSSFLRAVCLFALTIFVGVFLLQSVTAQTYVLDLGQWEFYVLTKPEMRTIGTKSVSLETVKARCGAPMTAGEIRIKGREKLREIAGLKEVTISAASQ